MSTGGVSEAVGRRGPAKRANAGLVSTRVAGRKSRRTKADGAVQPVEDTIDVDRGSENVSGTTDTFVELSL